MSNLLNKKKLLNRGPKIVPEQEFVLEETVQESSKKVAEPKVEEVPEEKPAKASAKKTPAKRTTPADITSIRVTKATRSKINALIQMGTADNADLLIDILLDEYIDTTLTKDEKKTYGIVLDILKKREN